MVGGAGTGVDRGGNLPLASIESPPLATILRWMDRESDNFTAELLLKQLGTLLATPGTTASGAAYVAQVLTTAGVPLTDAGRGNAVSVDHVAQPPPSKRISWPQPLQRSSSSVF